jgi:hypothetical protein
MPSATVNVSLADLVRLDEESAKSQKSRSQLIRESLGHKCAPCAEPHVEKGWLVMDREGTAYEWSGKGWTPYNPDADAPKPKRAKR